MNNCQDTTYHNSREPLPDPVGENDATEVMVHENVAVGEVVDEV